MCAHGEREVRVVLEEYGDGVEEVTHTQRAAVGAVGWIRPSQDNSGGHQI